MTSIQQQSITGLEHRHQSQEKMHSNMPLDEKTPSYEVSSDGVSIDATDGDEALELVGMRRTAQFSKEYNLRLRKKLDWVIPPLSAAVYFTQYLDKTSLNYASIMGFPITGQKYNLVALAFYVGFFIWEFPTQYIAQKLRLGKYLGMLESCVAPILVLIISMFYKKNEQSQRIAWFYVMVGLAPVFGGFVAYGISFDSDKSFASYRILFLMLGALAIVVGIAVLIWMPDSPVRANMLTREERIATLERIRDDQCGTANKTIKKAQIIEALTDIRTWLVVLSTLVNAYIHIHIILPLPANIPNGGLANFGFIIIKSFGYTSKQAPILGTPGGLIGAVATLVLGNAIGTETFLPRDAPGPDPFQDSLNFEEGAHDRPVLDYLPGKISMLVPLASQLFICYILRFINLRLNAKKRAHIAVLKARNGWTDEDIEREREKHAFLDLTNIQ
ncbi:MFS general substrate transporter [Sanghuangporus baumii]|uniref:MFS general substrate transporter n=1 Tax=Sanghuangporus baumii TaxID=108892 RepID=A0A9Q5I5W2_SANBA|nr:MFS general substrate transporter [Sanghuangporus baumii]